MRIRSIKPEFWRSTDISDLAIEDRLLFIGLWSYVDDNGVGQDRPAIIAADLFAEDLSRDPRETLARITGGLANLSEAGLIVRYCVENRDYLAINTWSKHQRIDKPNKPRYPLPDNENAQVRETLAESSRDPRETPAPGTGDQGNRGSEKIRSSADAETASDAEDADLERWKAQDRERVRNRDQEAYAEFDAWWAEYPRKVSKGQAMKAYKAARKKATADELLNGLRSQLPTLTAAESRFVPHAATWLNGERWADDLTAATPVAANGKPAFDPWTTPVPLPPEGMFDHG